VVSPKAVVAKEHKVNFIRDETILLKKVRRKPHNFMWALLQSFFLPNYTENRQTVIKMILLDNPFKPKQYMFKLLFTQRSAVCRIQRESSENSSNIRIYKQVRFLISRKHLFEKSPFLVPS
jgi:hypothetical protein